MIITGGFGFVSRMDSCLSGKYLLFSFNLPFLLFVARHCYFLSYSFFAFAFERTDIMLASFLSESKLKFSFPQFLEGHFGGFERIIGITFIFIPLFVFEFNMTIVKNP